jgi:hypothetical protein
MEDTYTPQAVNQARNSFKKKVRKSSATFFYGAMCGFFTTDELDDLLFEASEVARFLLEVEGSTLDIDQEIDIEDHITKVMRSVGEAAKTILKTRAEESTSDSRQPNTPIEKIKGVKKSKSTGASDQKTTEIIKRPEERNTINYSHSPEIFQNEGEIFAILNTKTDLGEINMLSATSDGIQDVVAHVKKTIQEVPITGLVAPSDNDKSLLHPIVPIQERSSGENNP